MVKDTKIGDIFRADHLVKNVLKIRLDNHNAAIVGSATKKIMIAPNILATNHKLEEKVKVEYEDILETLDNYQGEALGKLIKDLVRAHYYSFINIVERIYATLKLEIVSRNQFYSISCLILKLALLVNLKGFFVLKQPKVTLSTLSDYWIQIMSKCLLLTFFAEENNFSLVNFCYLMDLQAMWQKLENPNS